MSAKNVIKNMENGTYLELCSMGQSNRLYILVIPKDNRPSAVYVGTRCDLLNVSKWRIDKNGNCWIPVRHTETKSVMHYWSLEASLLIAEMLRFLN